MRPIPGRGHSPVHPGKGFHRTAGEGRVTASVLRLPNGRKAIQFAKLDGPGRTTLRIGKATADDADDFARRIEALREARTQGTTPRQPVLEWVARLPPVMRRRLHARGLIDLPAEQEAERLRQVEDAKPRLGAFLTEYVGRRIDVKPATKEVWSQVQRNLLAHFGEDRPMESVHEGNAEDFKMYLIGQKLAPTTVHKRLQFARMFFRAAVKRKLIPANPFAEVTAKAATGTVGERFITREETDRLLAKAPDTAWRTIIALARYGGLRCPSEVLSLRWTAIDWELDRIVVESPKTAHHPGKGSREIPLFPELRPILAEALEQAPDGAEFVVEKYRKVALSPKGWRNCNLRSQFERIVKRAGLKPWRRLFHALRKSRETELVKDHPIHVVTAWLGNTPRIAMKHYLMVTEADFAKAAGRAAEGALQKAMQIDDQSAAKSDADDGGPCVPVSTRNDASPCYQGLCAVTGSCGPESLAERTGFEPAEDL